MKLILIDGGPAAGKNTLGELITKKLRGLGKKVILLDLDTYVEGLNPKWVWEDEKQKVEDQKNARANIAKDIDKYLNDDFKVIVIGERFLTRDDVSEFVSKLKIVPQVYLYHLNVPFVLREKRLHERGPHSLIDLKKDQEDRDAIENWPGLVYENFNDPELDANKLISFIEEGKA